MKKKEIHVWKTHQVFESVQISQISTETPDKKQTCRTGYHQSSTSAKPESLAIPQLMQKIDPNQRVKGDLKGDINHED